MKDPTICADVIAEYEDGEHLVFVERLKEPKGLALIGGKRDPGETLCATAKREAREETALHLKILFVLGTWGKAMRDSRGDYISTVFVGRVSGTPKDEPGKTKVVFVKKSDLASLRDRLVLDHWEMLQQYLELSPTKRASAPSHAKPLKASEIAKGKVQYFPTEVIESFNELIAGRFDNGSAEFSLQEVITRMVKKGLCRQDIRNNGWLNVEDAYRAAGWSVTFDAPVGHENHPATFTFRRRRVN